MCIPVNEIRAAEWFSGRVDVFHSLPCSSALNGCKMEMTFLRQKPIIPSGVRSELAAHFETQCKSIILFTSCEILRDSQIFFAG